MDIAGTKPVAKSGTVVGNAQYKWALDNRLKAGAPVGKKAGYTDLNAALDALKGATAGNFPAAVLMQSGDRYFGYSLREGHNLLSKAAGMTWDTWTFHLDANDKVKLTNADAYAIVDGDRVIGRS